MALGACHMTATNEAVFINEIWSGRINQLAKAKLVAGNFFLDASPDFAGGGDLLHIPYVDSMSANSKTVASTVTPQNATSTENQLTVTTWKEASFIIEDTVAAQVSKSYTLQSMYADSAAYAIAKAVDSEIIGYFGSMATSVGASWGAVVDSEIRQAILNLDTYDAPQDDRAFFMHPSIFWGDIQGLDKFSLAVNAPVQDPVAKTPKAYLYGIPIYVTTQVPDGAQVSDSSGYLNVLAHKDAIVWASHGTRLQSNYLPEYLGTLVTVDTIYGATLNRSAWGCYFKALGG